MSMESSSRSPLTPMTLAEAIERVMARTDIPERRRWELCSAVRRLCRALGRLPSDVLADPTELRRRLAQMSPMAAGLSRGGWRNLKSLVSKALLTAGLISLPRRSQMPLPSPWRDLLDRMEDRYQRCALSRVARYCAGQGIAPEQVDDAIIASFGRTLLSRSLVDRPKQVHRDACRAWNLAVDTVDGWPPRKLTVPNNRRTYALPWSSFPASFLADVETYLTHLAGQDLSSETASRPASPLTIRNRRVQILELASALVHCGRNATTVRSLADLVELEAAKAALNFFWSRKGKKRNGQIHNFALLLVNIARRWIKVTPEHLDQLRALRRRVDPGKSGLTDGNRIKLLQFTDSANVAALVQLPRRLMEEVLRRDRGGVAEAVMVQTALAIAVLLAAPLRIRNLATLDLERHIVRSRSGPYGVVHLVVPAEEVKNRVPLEFELPSDVVALLDLYVERFRPRLAKVPSLWLFPARTGGHKAIAGLSVQITRTIRKTTGLKMHVHLFRHLSAFLFLTAHPGEFETVRLLLGHRSIATTVSAYCGIEQAAAFRRYDEVIARYRSGEGRQS